MWTAHQGEHLLVSGFVHPNRSQGLEALKSSMNLMPTVKGLKAAPIYRSAGPATARCSNNQQQRQSFTPVTMAATAMTNCGKGRGLERSGQNSSGRAGELATALRWNAGTHPWQAGCEASSSKG